MRLFDLLGVLLMVLAIGCVSETGQGPSGSSSSTTGKSAHEADGHEHEGDSDDHDRGGATESGAEHDALASMREERAELEEVKTMLEARVRSGDSLTDAELTQIAAKVEAAETRLADIEKRLAEAEKHDH